MNKRELTNRIVGSLHSLLVEAMEAKRARERLERHGIRKPSRSLGYMPKDREWLAHFLTEKGITREQMQATGLLTKAGQAKYAGKIVLYSKGKFAPYTESKA